MDWVSLGIQLTTLASGLGGGPSPDQMILDAVIKLTQQMHGRFDRLELMLGDLQRNMSWHFQRVHEALIDIRRGQVEAMRRLEELHEAVSRLGRSVDYYARAEFEIADRNQWQPLTNTNSAFVTRRDPKTPFRELLAPGLRQLVEFGVDHSDHPALIGSETAFEGIQSCQEGLNRLDVLPRSGTKTDLLLRLEQAVFRIALPGPRRVADEEYWAYAARAYMALVDDNLRDAWLDVPVKRGLIELREKGETIRAALVAGRQPARLEGIVRGLGDTYQICLAEVHELSTAGTRRSSMGLPRDAKSLVTLFHAVDRTWARSEVEQKQKAKLSALISPRAGFREPEIRVLRRNGKYQKVDGGWEIVHPALRALAHFGSLLKPKLETDKKFQKNPRPLPEDYIVQVKVIKFDWAPGQKISDTKHTSRLRPHLEFSIPRMTSYNHPYFNPSPWAPIRVVLALDQALEVELDRTYGQAPRDRKSEAYKRWREKYDAWVKEEIPKAEERALDQLIDEWAKRVNGFIETHPDPWPLTPGVLPQFRHVEPGLVGPPPYFALLEEVMRELSKGVTADLYSLITLAPSQPVVYGREAAKPDTDPLRVWHLDETVGRRLEKAVEELHFRQQVLLRHLLHFAPDYLFSRSRVSDHPVPVADDVAVLRRPEAPKGKVPEDELEAERMFRTAQAIRSQAFLPASPGAPLWAQSIFTVTVAGLDQFAPAPPPWVAAAEWLKNHAWGRTLLADASLQIAIGQRDGKALRVAELIQRKSWETDLAGIPALHTNAGRALVDAYRSYLKSLPQGVEPQCMQVDAVTAELSRRIAMADELTRLLVNAKALRESYKVQDLVPR